MKEELSRDPPVELSRDPLSVHVFVIQLALQCCLSRIIFVAFIVAAGATVLLFFRGVGGKGGRAGMGVGGTRAPLQRQQPQTAQTEHGQPARQKPASQPARKEIKGKSKPI